MPSIARRRTPGGALMTALLPALNRGPALSTRPFAHASELVPHTTSRRFSWSHNGLMIPNLPEPLRFLSITTIAGSTGAPIAEVRHVPPPPGGPRNRATLNVSTAATAPGFWGDYRMDVECELADDGSLFRYGGDVTIAGRYPSYTVASVTPDLSIDLALECTDTVSWFVRTPIYRHLSLLTGYSGTITHLGTVYQVEGSCVFEHARSFGSYNFTTRPVRHPWLRVPLDFFTYQVVDLGNGQQLLLVSVEAEGRVAMNAAFLRDETGRSVALDRGVVFEVVQHQPEPATTPDGAAMALPLRFRWRTPAGSAVAVDLEGLVDAPFSWGLGNGYVGCYSFAGTVDGAPVVGSTGYIEYIDRR